VIVQRVAKQQPELSPRWGLASLG